MPSSAGGATMSLPSTVAPSAFRALAMPRPMPPPQPVTRARSPSRSFMLMAAMLAGDRWRPRPRFDVALVERGLAETRAAAQRLVMAGLVFSGDERLDKAGQGDRDPTSRSKCAASRIPMSRAAG